jgi:cytochrome P450
MATQLQDKPKPGRPEKSITLKLQDDTFPIGVMPSNFEPEYVAGAVAPYILGGRYLGERPALPMIDLAYSKEKAIDPHMWGLLYDGWAPNPEEEGTSVFIRGYENRGPDNERKRIYMSATTPDLIATRYREKIARFFDLFLADANAGKPLMQAFYAHYFDLYWELHLGVSGDAIPLEVRQFGTSFNAVLGFKFPTLEVVHENYMTVRRTRQALKAWVDSRIQALIDGKVPDADRTFVHYWLENGRQGENFRRKDIVFECFHNLLAFSQWGNTIYNVMARLEPSQGEPVVRACFELVMKGRPDERDGGPFTPLDRFVMELFRTISPNGGSLSSLPRQHALLGAAFSTVITPHLATSTDPRHWNEPLVFDPDRYKTAPTTVDSDEQRAKDAGLARCPFPPQPLAVKDGRDAQLANSAYGAVYPVVDGRPFPVCDAAGYAPFGFGYRRCAGEHLTLEFVEEFLRRVWKNRLSFKRLDLADPQTLPVGPGTVILDDIAFIRSKQDR